MASIRSDNRRDGTTAHRVYFRHSGQQTCITFEDPDAAEVFKTAVDQLGADRALALHRIERNPRGAATATTGPEMTVAQWVRHHIDHLTGVEQYTLDVYNRYLRNDIEPILGTVPLATLTEEDISAWVKWMATTPSSKTGRVVTPKTLRNKYGFLSGALGAAVGKHIGANPAAGRRLPRTTGTATAVDDDDDGDMRMLTRDEFDQLLAATTEPWRPLMEFLVYSGCRWGEAVALKPRHVDRKAGVVRIRQAWKKSSKGYQIGSTKTKRSRRDINVSSDVLDQLDYSHEWLFVNREGGPVRYQGFRRRVWDKAVGRAELVDPQPTPHDLRHTCASWMIAENVPLTVVSRHLGHENIQITADLYTDVDRTSFAAAAAAIRPAPRRPG
ncbi:integrase [Mycolicibacter heraklionensis]|uniref:Integrase n=1 Tax=Mycolicibacter heraklionensis TaxID=512402 RepID=A0ABR5F9Y9_9MYCO|nr:site-specific integrase [Mycolicibacter heraklionensis]KLO25866.1 integrase [Mycolicibacter heraklionensis]